MDLYGWTEEETLGYHDRKMGITEDAISIKYDQAPNSAPMCIRTVCY